MSADTAPTDVVRADDGDGVTPSDPTAPRVLLTASEAYPAFEEIVLGAHRRVRAAFRIFDPFTKLRSTAARAVGDDWFDLIAHKLAEGVDFEIRITDFDPVARPELHGGTWASLRGLWAAAEASGAPQRLHAEALMHPARTGWIPTLVFWPKARRTLVHEARRLNRLPESRRLRELDERPGLRSMLVRRGDGLSPRFWPPAALVPATHHQKIAVVDDDWLYVGGLDLDERRFDTLTHERAPEETWHDVQTILTGPVVAEAHRHLDTFRTLNDGEGDPAPVGATLLRTVSARRHFPGITVGLSPRRRVRELRAANLAGIRSARNFIYIETQFLRDQGIARALARAAQRHPTLKAIIVLPAAPEDVAFGHSRGPDARFGEFLQSRAVSTVRRAFGNRLLLASPARPIGDPAAGRDHLRGAPIIYVHAKVSVFDECSAIIASANLNGRSMSWDTEVGVRFDDPALAAHIQRRSLEHWTRGAIPLEQPRDDLFAALRDLVRRDATRPPKEREGFLLPFPAGPARRFGRKIPVIPEEMV